jgi:excisionase family DNA binding protein
VDLNNFIPAVTILAAVTTWSRQEELRMSAVFEPIRERLMLEIGRAFGIPRAVLYNEPVPIEPQQDNLLTTAEAADKLGCKEQQIRDMIRGGIIAKSDMKKVGRYWLIKESALEGKQPGKKGRPKSNER